MDTKGFKIRTSHGSIRPAFPVLFYWESEMGSGGQTAIQHILPSVYVDVIFPLSKWIDIAGAEPKQTAPFVSPILSSGRKLFFSPGSRLFGIRFMAGHAGEILACPPRELLQAPNEFYSVTKSQIARPIYDAVFGQPDFVSRVIDLNHFFGKTCSATLTSKPICDLSLEYIRSHPNAKVSDLTRLTGYSRRWLEISLKENIGVPPQQVIRITRFNRFLHGLKNKGLDTLTTLAMDSGYYDQGHQIREFRRFIPTTPTAFIESDPMLCKVMNHI